MALEAGSVYAVLGGRFNPAGFAQFDGAMKRSVASTKSAETAMASSFSRTGTAAQAMASGVAGAASKMQAAQIAQQRAALRVEGAMTASAAATKKHGAESLIARQRALDLAQAQMQLTQANRNLANATAAHAAAQSQLTAKQSAGSKAAQALGLTSRNVAGAGIAAVGLAIYGSLKASANFQKQMADLGAVTGASGAQLKQMGQAAMTVGAQTGTGATRAAQAMTELAKGGLDANTATAALAGTVAMAQAGSLDLATAGETVANALNLFAMDGKQATQVADAFANAANSTTADIGFFSQGMAQGGAAAKAAGLNFQEATVFLEAMAANGFKSGSDAGTSMKTALIQLANPSKRAAEEINKLGISFFKTNGDMKSLPTISKQLGDAWDGLSKKEKLASAARLAGTDGMRALFALVDQGPAKLRRFAAANEQTGTAADVARKKMDSLSGQSQRLGAELETLGIKIGQNLEPSLRDAASALADFFAQMRNGEGFGGTVGTILTQLGRVQQTIWAMASGNVDFVNMAEIWGQGFSRAAIKILGVIRSIAVGMKLVGLASQADINRIDETTRRLRNLEIKQRVTADVKQATTALSKLNSYKLAPKVQKILTNGDTTAREKLNELVKIGIPRKVARLIVSGDTTAKQKIQMLQALGIDPKVAKIIAKDLTRSGITSARNAINSLPASKSINLAVTTTKTIIEKVQRRAAGRSGASGAETALVGEGGGPEMVINRRTGEARRIAGPTIMQLTADDYVIPTEKRYRGRANELMMSLAQELGFKAYKKGKQPAKSKPAPKPAPAKASTPRGSANAAKKTGGGGSNKGGGNAKKPKENAQQKAAREERRRILGKQGLAFSRHSLDWYDQEIAKEERYKDNKGKDKKLTKRALEARRRLTQLRKEKKKAQGYKAKIDAATAEADIALDQMRTADTQDNQGAFNTAWTKRREQLARAVQLINAAVGESNPSSTWNRELRAQLAKLQGDQADLGNTPPPVIEPDTGGGDGTGAGDGTGGGDGGPASETTFNAGEQARLAQLEAGIALASLTETTVDDRAALQAKLDFLTPILAAATATQGAGRGGFTAITEIANDLRGTRDTLQQLTDAANTPTADQQQLIDQARSQGLAQGQTAFIDRLAGATMQGAGQTLVFQSYVPPSPTEAKRLADYTVGGIGFQGGSPSSTERVGV